TGCGASRRLGDTCHLSFPLTRRGTALQWGLTSGFPAWHRPVAHAGGHRATTLARLCARAFFYPSLSLTGGFMPGLMLRASSRNRDIFDPAHERDACGVGFVADVEGRASHSILEPAVYSLCRVRHRGAVDADGKSGDGAGILTSLPVDFFAAEAARMGTPADPSFIGVAMTF